MLDCNQKLINIKAPSYKVSEYLNVCLKSYTNHILIKAVKSVKLLITESTFIFALIWRQRLRTVACWRIWGSIQHPPGYWSCIFATESLPWFIIKTWKSSCSILNDAVQSTTLLCYTSHMAAVQPVSGVCFSFLNHDVILWTGAQKGPRRLRPATWSQNPGQKTDQLLAQRKSTWGA